MKRGHLSEDKGVLLLVLVEPFVSSYCRYWLFVMSEIAFENATSLLLRQLLVLLMREQLLIVVWDLT